MRGPGTANVTPDGEHSFKAVARPHPFLVGHSFVADMLFSHELPRSVEIRLFSFLFLPCSLVRGGRFFRVV
jgi:hypothetical protein